MALIDREEAIQAALDWKVRPDDAVYVAIKGAIQGNLEQVAAVDAAPVVHAKWTTVRTSTHDGEWYCSACEYEPVVFMDSTYCPNCGARMDGDRNVLAKA